MRSGVERRRAERRRLEDRRQLLNRRRLRRRRGTPSPYTAEQVEQIRRAFATPGSRVACPACGGIYTLGHGHPRGKDNARRVQCSSCGKTAVVTNSWLARVMVIAEKPELRDAMRAILTEYRHEVVDAADASVGLWAFRQNPADVVFIDVFGTGRISAGEFIRQLRKDFPDARIVAISGRTSYGVRDPLVVAKQLGAVHVIRAPFSRAQVLQVMQEALC